MTFIQNRYSFSWFAAVFALVIFYAQVNDSAQEYRPVDQLGRPRSVETGNELDPQHNGFLQCAVDRLGPEFRHSDTAEVFDKLATKRDPANIAVIVGHGMSGFQCTGEGDNCPGANDAIMMAGFNYNFWQPLAQKIQNDFASLSLLGCEIGLGPKGIKFLQQMADTIERPVRGPDSIIFCRPDGIVFDDGGQWVEVRPNAPPPSVHYPKPYSVKPFTTFEFNMDGKRTGIRSNLISVELFEHRTVHQKEFHRIPLETATLLQLVDFGSPFETSGRPAAIITGRFHLTLKIGDKLVQRAFVLYNDVLVEDTVEQDVFYRADRKGLSEYLLRVANEVTL